MMSIDIWIAPRMYEKGDCILIYTRDGEPHELASRAEVEYLIEELRKFADQVFGDAKEA